MKKLLAIFIALVMALGVCTACSKKPAADPTTAPTEAADLTPISILAGVLARYRQDDAVFHVSLDMAVDMQENSDLLQTILYIPQGQMKHITGAATMMHMNQSSFTGAALQLEKGTDPNAFAAELADAVAETQWLCGIPEKMFIATVDDSFMVIAYGLDNDQAPLITTFQTHLKEAYGDRVAVLKTIDTFT